MIFKPMRREDVLKALEGHENVIAPTVKAHEAYFKTLSCPSCGGEVIPVINDRKLFREGSILPNYLAKCSVCDVVFEPYTKIQITLPSE